MSSSDDRDVPVTPPQDTGPPDQVERDPAALNSAEDLDEDRLRLDPLEEGIEPPERWSEAQHYGTTDYEQSQREGLDRRLSEEEPDVPRPDESDNGSGADELDEPVASAGSVEDVDQVTDVDPTQLDQNQPEQVMREAARRGQTADEGGGGSVAEAIRTPDEPE